MVDAKQVAPGRGAYLCGAGCLKAALKRRALGRAFKRALGQMDAGALETELEALKRGT